MSPESKRIFCAVAVGALMQAHVIVASCSPRFPYAAPWPSPAGWTEAPRRLFDQTWRSKDPARFLRVTADFNGDGVEDKA
jgi:hypothetical protein